MHPLLTSSATRLARLIREGEVSAREVVDRHIARIEQVNPAINAVVADRFAAAREEAARADELVRQGGDLPPLLGVPCTIKECFATAGMPQTAGLLSRRGLIAVKDCTTVARLRRAGAIPLGATNLSELCMWMESHNRVYGRTRNPYDPRRTAGGSSGGEGAIVGAGGAPFGLGADIGGSIRMPAFFCGVFGHKPTGGLVPSTGHYPLPANQALHYLSVGPLCRRAEDLWPLLRLLAGPDGQDSGCRVLPGDPLARDPDAVRIAELEVLTIEGNGRIRVHPELIDAQRRCVRALSAAGARVHPVRLPALRHSFEIWSALMDQSQSPSFRSLLSPEEELDLPGQLLRLVLGRSPHTLPSLMLALLEKLPGLVPGHTRRFCALGEELKAEVDRLLDGPRVLLYPSYPTVAPRHRRPLVPPWCWVYTGILNVLLLPVTQVPLGLQRAGLPLGVQVAAAEGGDALTIAVARFLERTFGGWVPPST